ncbi:glucokinase [Ketogulonicigenium robustum]|uniref:Glucokinase n=1 Tax=Ketogulonicigenium robustum TaxID=92947 RepID=A0A1W6NZV5_9RHOB|nr:glucokinase [Ketogulonicigenium robustum]ARO14778.1 glucokinase [Ketogulonicigenium robustum]
MTPELSLVADIGGTNTRLALASAGRVQHDTVRRFANEGRQLPDILQEYLAAVLPDGRPTRACLALAGPIDGDTGAMTNLSWTIRAPEIAAFTSAGRCLLINDLQAQGHALAGLDSADLTAIIDVTPTKNGARLVIGMGTGMNAAAVFPTAQGAFVPPAEAGHVNLPANTENGRRVVDWMLANLGQAQVEDALSGTGFVKVHNALHGEALTAPDLLELVEAGDEKAVLTMETVVALMGGVVGDLALTFLPRGGIYLTGGFASAMTPWLTKPHYNAIFTQAFANKGKISPVMAAFPLYVIGDDFAALQGCAAHLANG